MATKLAHYWPTVSYTQMLWMTQRTKAAYLPG
jgi:hypothetical protein